MAEQQTNLLVFAGKYLGAVEEKPEPKVTASLEGEETEVSKVSGVLLLCRNRTLGELISGMAEPLPKSEFGKKKAGMLRLKAEKCPFALWHCSLLELKEFSLPLDLAGELLFALPCLRMLSQSSARLSREVLRRVLGAVARVNREFGEPAMLSEIAREARVESYLAQKALEVLERDGYVYEARPGRYKAVYEPEEVFDDSF